MTVLIAALAVLALYLLTREHLADRSRSQDWRTRDALQDTDVDCWERELGEGDRS